MSDWGNWRISLSGVVIHPFPHNASHLELHFPFCRDLDFLQGSGILCSSCCSFFDFEYAKITKLQAVTFTKFCGYLIEELLHYCFGSNILTLSPFRNSFDKFFFCYCYHQLILKSNCLDYFKEYKWRVVSNQTVYHQPTADWSNNGMARVKNKLRRMAYWWAVWSSIVEFLSDTT